METKGMFKRIAALTLAALTVVTSSGIDYNLLSANAAESATQVTNVSTESTLQTKNAKVNASSKISFSTDEDLKQAVEDGSYTVDVETNKVKVASIKYNKTLLEMGTDFTATAKRTSATTKKIDGVYKYVYTITIAGKGKYTGTAKKTGVTMKSQIKPKVTTKKKAVKKADALNEYEAFAKDKSTPEYDLTTDDNHKWQFIFNDAVIYEDKSNSKYKIAYYCDGQEPVEPTDLTITCDGEKLTSKEYKITWGGNTGINTNSGNRQGRINFEFQPSFWNKHPDINQDNYSGGITLLFKLVKSVFSNGCGLQLNYDNQNYDVKRLDSTAGEVEEPLEYTKDSDGVKPDVYYNLGQQDYIKLGNAKSYVNNTKISANSQKAYLTADIPHDNVGQAETVTIKYTIKKRSMSGTTDSDGNTNGGTTISISSTEYTYIGQEIKPSPTVNENHGSKKQLTENDDYTVSYSNNINANTDSEGKAVSGKATPRVTVTAADNSKYYTGSTYKEFNIKPKAVDSEITISGINTNGVLEVPYTGKAVKPDPTITYKPKDTGKTLTLTEGTDYTLDYTKDVIEVDNTGSVKITFKGNYSGELTKTFKVVKGSLEAKGTTMSVNNQAWFNVEKNNDDVVDATGYPVTYSPVEEERPLIELKNSNNDTLNYSIDGTINKDTDYVIEKPDSTDGKTWPAVGTWKVTLTGENKYEGSNLKVLIKVEKLDINKLDIAEGGFNSDGSSYAKLKYTTTINGKTYEKVIESDNGTNFTIKPENSSSLTTADANVELTLTGQGNYTGTKNITAGFGKDLSKAVETKDDNTSSDIRIRAFDPFTGQELTDSVAMPYYGKDITPQYIVQIKNGNNWKTVSYKKFSYENITEITNVDPKTYLYTATVTLTAAADNTEVYGSKTLTYNVTPHSLSKSNEKGDWTHDIADDIKVDAKDVTSKTDLNDISSNLHVTLNPEHAGQFIAVIASKSATSVETVANPNSTAINPYVNNTVSGSNVVAYWTAPKDYESKVDYTVDFQYDKNGQPLNNGKVVITGKNNYSQYAYITLGNENIGKDDFYITYSGKEYDDNPAKVGDIDYDENDHRPDKIALYKKAVGNQIEPTQLVEDKDYRVVYVNTDGDLVDKYGYILNGQYQYVDQNNNVINDKAVKTDSSGNLYGTDGNKLTKDSTDLKTNNKISTGKFSETGDYKIYLIGISSNDDGSGYFGKREIDYTIKGSDSSLVATFNVTRTPYSASNTTVSSGAATATTLQPDFVYKKNNEKAPNNALKLKVFADGDELQYSEDGTKGDYKISWGTDLLEPGKKTFTITGINKYKGQTTTASYLVYVDMSQLGVKNGLLKSTPEMYDSKQNQTMYYNGGSSLTTADNKTFTPDQVYFSTITGMTTLTATNDTDYSIDIDGKGNSNDLLLTEGTHTITFVGNGSTYLGSYSLNVNVVITRAGILWTGDSTTKGNDTTNLKLPWTMSGYSLGSGAMSLYKTIKDVKTPVTLKADDQITVKYPGKDTFESVINYGSGISFKSIGEYTIRIQGPKGTTAYTELTFSILYDLSNVTIDLNLPSNTPFKDEDYYKDGLDKIVVKPAGSEDPLTYKDDYEVSRKYTDNAADDGFKRAGTIVVSLEEVSGHSMFFTDNHPTESYTITKLQEDTNYQLDASQTNPLITYTYNGERQTPEETEKDLKTFFGSKVTYKDGGTTRTLTYGVDYTVSYQTDSTNAGWKSIIITGIGNYGGMKTFSNVYVINKYDLSTLNNNKNKITIKPQYYTGKPITPQTIKIDGITGDLKFGSDYTIENPRNNTKRGTATVNVTGSGTNFEGTVTDVQFIIKKLNLTELSESEGLLIVTDATYNKGGSVGVDNHIQIFVPDGAGKIQLDRKSNYTLIFNQGSNTYLTDPTNAGNYKVTIEAKDSSEYVEGTTTVDFKINPLNIEDIANEFIVANAAWTGSKVTPKITLGGKALDSTYDVEWENNTDACAKTREEMLQYDPNFDANKLPTAIITGSGNYVGTIRKPFQIGSPFSDATITTTSNAKLTYNGSPQKKEFTVTYTDGTGARKTLDSARYTVTYPDNITDAGDKVVLFTANGGPLYGTKTVTYTIYPVSGSVWSVEFTNLTMDSTGQYTVQYQGAAITPEVKAYVLGAGGSRTEIPLKSSEIKYANNTAAGTASVSVSPNNYEGTKTLYFRILGVDISGDDVYAAFTDGITRRQYTGTALTPAVTVTFAGSLGTVTLRKDVDFSLTYENNTKAGAADVKITGIGNYSGTKTLDFDIFANLNDKTSVFTIPKQMYTGEAITELTGATLKAGGNDLKLGTDYTLSITSTDSFRTKGTAIFTAQGKYYEGTRTVQFEIGNDASMYNILGVAATYVYDRQAHKPVPVVTDKQGTVYSVDSVTYASTSDGDTCINAGNVKMQIVITSHGQSVTIPYNYTIEPKNINTASITPIADVDYNGKAHTPTIRITDGTNLLTGSPTSWDGTADFVYTYYNNVQPGTATVSIQGINNYTGVANVYFAIIVKAAPQMIVTAMPSGRLKVTWKKVSGVSGYRIFYSSANGTQKQTTLSSSKKSTYITGLTRGVVYTVGLQSFITANGQNGYSTASVQQIATSTSKPKITSAKSTGKGKIKITWKKVSNATAYMVYRKTAGSSKWVRVKTTKSTSFTNTGLKSGKKYTYKVISYKQSGVKRSFSKYSTGKTVKAK